MFEIDISALTTVCYTNKLIINVERIVVDAKHAIIVQNLIEIDSFNHIRSYNTNKLFKLNYYKS